MRTFAIAFALLVVCAIGPATCLAWPVPDQELKDQNEKYERWWGQRLVWKFDDLPLEANVPDFRTPYAGYIYPDNSTGTVSAMWKYDQAFHHGRSLATSFERGDIASMNEVTGYRRTGLFGRGQVAITGIPYWMGHCNGWTSASIRHAEPEKSVTRNGVVFTPSDIKAMLAELYVYNENEMLGGETSYVINPATLHVIVANWIGRSGHSIGMETTPGREVWNYPLYAYKATANKFDRGRQVEVTMRGTYAYMLDRERDKAPANPRTKYFHYVLYLDENGVITGGDYYRDSERIDMLWTARRLSKGGQKGNERGNPYLDIENVMSIWRESVSPDLVSKWVNIDVEGAPATGDVAAAETTLDAFDTPSSDSVLVEPETVEEPTIDIDGAEVESGDANSIEIEPANADFDADEIDAPVSSSGRRIFNRR